ncbi:MAG TPA: hypothetical protein EYP90_06940, partial [Chromatiaceae bacterium]|nr:hypothetical protein [Chromatiaceae bacterium]
DPSMHSSQDEQDSRILGDFTMIPMFEPSSQQEAYDMVFHGFELSEKYKTPVMLRLTTRLAHSRAGVAQRPILPENEGSLPEDKRQFVLLPGIARKRYKMLIENQKVFLEESEKSPFNSYTDGKDKSLGIIACGLAYNYLMENFQDGECPYPVVKLTQYPAPTGMIKKLVESTEKVLVLEEGMPMIERLRDEVLTICRRLVCNGLQGRKYPMNGSGIPRRDRKEPADGTNWTAGLP